MITRDEPTGVSFNPDNGHLFISDDSERGIFEVNPGPDAVLFTPDDIITVFSTTDFASADPEGVTYDRSQGFLYIADGVNSEIYQVTPGANGVFDGISPSGDDQVTSFDTESFGLTDPEGIAWDELSGHLYVVGNPVNTVFQFTTGGALVRTIDISAAGADKPAGLAYAPGSTDPGQLSIWIVDRMVDNNTNSNENDGRAYEFSVPVVGGNLPPSVEIFPPTGNGNGSLIWNERFESPGSDEIWSQGLDITGSSTIDLDYPAASIAGAPAGWGSESIELNMVSGNGAELEHRFGADLPKTYTQFEFVLKQHSFGNNQDGVFVEIMESTVGKNFAKWMIDNSSKGGGLNLEVWIEYDGTPHAFYSPPLSLDTRYVVELYWDTTADLWEYRFDGVTLGVGALTGNAADWELDRIRLGDNGQDTDSDYIVYIDNVSMSEVDWAGAGFQIGDPITFSGTATDPEDGDLTASLGWASSLDGSIGSGGSFSTSSLSLGTHTITASVADTEGLPGSDEITLTVSPETPNQAPASSFTWAVTDLAVDFTDTSTDTDGSVTAWSWDFGDGNTSTARNPQHTYASAGPYQVSLTVTDDDGSSHSSTNTVTTYNPGEVPDIFEIRVAVSSDDAEEGSSGTVTLTSSDLELVSDGSNQTVGMRFNGVSVPQGATITGAYVQFTTDETGSATTSLLIGGEAADNPVTFSTAALGISSRSRTASSVLWSPAPWTLVGESGLDQRTSDISSIVQEIVGRPGWSSGNSLVLIVTGSGERTAESVNGDADAAPLLHVEYLTTSNRVPTASYTWTATDLTVDFTDTSTDGDGTVTGWNWNFGDGNTSTAQNPQHTYASAWQLHGDADGHG